MDNVLTYMSYEVKDHMIEAEGAYLLYATPYSLDLSPIEYAFNIYKSYLKRHAKDFGSDKWYKLHVRAIQSISRDTAIKDFRK